MLPFAVTVEGEDPAQGRWVLAVEGERLLLSDPDGSLHWRLLSECKLVKVSTPDMPIAVIPVQPRDAGIVIPAAGRNGRN